MTIRDFIECAAPLTGVSLWDADYCVGQFEDARDIPQAFHDEEVYRIEICGSCFVLTVYSSL